MTQSHPSQAALRAPRAEALPSETPAWITPELVQVTLRVWQPFYPSPLTPHNAVTMLLNVGQLLKVLSGA